MSELTQIIIQSSEVVVFEINHLDIQRPVTKFPVLMYNDYSYHVVDAF